ncbi:MAG: ribonuclease HII [Bacteroidales bacterium]|nr:ribonuclease HII [Anaerotignum sp.]MCI5679161.1 ribonuclease HII [Bacteroidales bacterium]MDY3926935.1 ribonuclease HII [Anaerotignum sp.]
MQSISEIKEILSSCSMEALPEQLEKFEADSRKGVQNLLTSFRKKYDKHLQELARLEEILTYERGCWEAGYELVAGIDEVGRGPLAGPVVAAAVILPKECKIEGVNDSKKLSAKKREELYDIILEKALSYGIGIVSNERIDEINILQATYEAMREALSQLSPKADYILADAVTIPMVSTPQRGIIKGDAKSMSIGAASIVAKVYRDRLMEAFDEVYPGYGFGANKGYGSAEHIEGIKKLGITPIHRKTFVKNFLPQDGDTTTDKGNRGEALAAKQMEKMGYEILERNFHALKGEIDIIAKKDNYIVFTEVKYRKNEAMGSPAEAVNHWKQQHIIRAAKAYMAQNCLEEMGYDFRFDVAEVLSNEGKTYFRYTEDAFQMK